MPDSLGFLLFDAQGRAGQHQCLLMLQHSRENQLQEFEKANWGGQDKKNGWLLVGLGRETFFLIVFVLRVLSPKAEHCPAYAPWGEV